MAEVAERFAYKHVMPKIDALPADVRAVVHEYGWEFVNQMLKLGCTGARQMRHIAYSVNAGRGPGSEIRDRPNEAEVADIAQRIANYCGRAKPSEKDGKIAFAIANRMFSAFHWGRCRCIK